MDIESNTCDLESVSTLGWMIPFISKLKKLSKRVNGLHEIKRLVWRILVVYCAIVQKEKPQEL